MSNTNQNSMNDAANTDSARSYMMTPYPTKTFPAMGGIHDVNGV